MNSKILVSIGLLAATTAFASGAGAPPKDNEPLPPIDRNIDPIELNPTVLRDRLLSSNIDIRISANGVQRAKEQVNLARSNTFIPSLNLGGALSSLVNPSFLWTSISALLPFLMPSNWFDMFQQENLLEADKQGYHALELDTFSSAYSLYEIILNDKQLSDVLNQDLADWRTLEEVTKLNRTLARATDNDVANAIGQRALAENRALALQALVKVEIADLRQMLAYHPDKPVSLVAYNVPESKHESVKIDDALQEAFDLAPERKQIDFLINASENAKWSRVFSFINAPSFSSQAAPGESHPDTQFKSFQVAGSLNLNWGIINNVRLAEIDIQEQKLHKQELVQDLEHTLDSIYSQYDIVKREYDTAKEAEDTFRANFENNTRRYDQGEIDLNTLLLARIDIDNATNARIQAQTDLNTLRITLHRTFRTAEFADIKGCEVPNTPANRKKYNIPDSPDVPYCLPVTQ